MGKLTGISWTDHTFNAWWGCTKVSEECDNCYAATTDMRYGESHWGKGAPRRTFGDKHWAEPLVWDRAAAKAGAKETVFCCSMADVMDDEAPEGARERLWELVDATPHLLWQLLTKRPHRYSRYLPKQFVHSNVWLGTSSGKQEFYDVRWPILAAVAAERELTTFISYEPALGPLTLEGCVSKCGTPDWLIFGGETGVGRRPMEQSWAENIKKECTERGVAFFMKQMSARTPAQASALIPADLLIRQFPETCDRLESSPEIISSKTPAVISETTNVASEKETLEREIDDKALEIIGQFRTRCEDELLPLLYRMRELLPYGEWGKWYERFRKRCRLKLTMRTIQRKFKELESGWEDAPSVDDASDEGEDAAEEVSNAKDDEAPASLVNGSPKEMLAKRLNEMRFDLLGGYAPVDADPIRDSEARIARAVMRIEEVQLAIDEGLLATPDAPADNPILTKLPVPDPSPSNDPHAALLQGAFIAAADASNAVAEADIEPRFIPAVRFYTTRSSMKLSKYLREHGSDLKLNYRQWRGKHCFSLGCYRDSLTLPMFKTQEEARAFEIGFRSALPDTVVWGEPRSNGG